MPDHLDCPRCGATSQAPDPACPECREEQECRSLRDRLFGANPEMTLRTD